MSLFPLLGNTCFSCSAIRFPHSEQKPWLPAIWVSSFYCLYMKTRTLIITFATVCQWSRYPWHRNGAFPQACKDPLAANVLWWGFFGVINEKDGVDKRRRDRGSESGRAWSWQIVREGSSKQHGEIDGGTGCLSLSVTPVQSTLGKDGHSPKHRATGQSIIPTSLRCHLF